MNDNYVALKETLDSSNCTLIAVSKTQAKEAILNLYKNGQRNFGENKVQELAEKYTHLPKDIQWHLIGHLQTNKVKTIVPFVYLIHSIDSLKLLQEINREANKINRTINVLLQIYIAKEESKFGLDAKQAIDIVETYLDKDTYLTHVRICGIMGMATNTDDLEIRKEEFKQLKEFYQFLKASYFLNKPEFKEISMGMSDDYTIAIEQGATMVRIGSLLFGNRN